MGVRTFKESDRDSLRQVYLESRRSTFSWLDSESLHLSDFDRDTDGETIWVVERNGTVVAFVSIQNEGNFIHHLFVLPSWFGRGCGSELLATALANIGRPARLKCIARNARALSFYRANGWRKVGEGMSEDGKHYVLETIKP